MTVDSVTMQRGGFRASFTTASPSPAAPAGQPQSPSRLSVWMKAACLLHLLSPQFPRLTTQSLGVPSFTERLNTAVRRNPSVSKIKSCPLFTKTADPPACTVLLFLVVAVKEREEERRKTGESQKREEEKGEGREEEIMGRKSSRQRHFLDVSVWFLCSGLVAICAN